MRQKVWIIVVGLLMLLPMTFLVNAETFTIADGDEAALRAALTNAQDGDVIELATNGNYKLTEMVIIQMEGTVTLNGNGSTITGSDEHLGIVLGDVPGDDVHFVVNNTFFSGSKFATIWVTEYATLEINDSVFTDNHTPGAGGVIFSQSRSIVINNSAFERNTTMSGGGVLSLYFDEPTNTYLGIHGSIFIENSTSHEQADKNGGVIAIATTDVINIDIDIIDSTFRQNSADGSGGVLYFEGYGNVDINVQNTQFEENSASNKGVMHVYTDQGNINLNVEDSTFFKNRADSSYALWRLLAEDHNVNVHIARSTFDQNESDHTVAEMEAEQNSTTIIRDSTFTENKMLDCGGGIVYVYSGSANATLDIAHTQFVNNTNTNCARAAFYVEGNRGTTFRAHDSLFQSNRAKDVGVGEIYGYDGLLDVLITDSQFIENSATDGSNGAVYIYQSSGDATGGIYSSRFHKNTATKEVGALYISLVADDFTIANSVFTENEALNGDAGALLTDMSSTNVTLIIEDTRFENNRSHGDGFKGGAWYHDGGTAVVRRSLFANNSTGGDGGGAYLEGIAAIYDTTFYNNSAGNAGGGIYANPDSASQLNGITLTNNRAIATNSGGIYYAGTVNTLHIYNSIIAGNQGQDCVIVPGGHLLSGGYNIFGQNGNANGCPVSSSDLIPEGGIETVLDTQDGNIPFLRDNGGTMPTIAVLDTGPAFNAADPGITVETSLDRLQDNRGFARIGFDRMDIGAFEIQDGIAPAIASVTSSVSGVFNSGNLIPVTLNFTELVSLTGGNLWLTLDNNGAVFIAPFGPASSITGYYLVTDNQNSARLNVMGVVLDAGASLKDISGLSLVDFDIPAGHNLADTAAIAVMTPLTRDDQYMTPVNTDLYVEAANGLLTNDTLVADVPIQLNLVAEPVAGFVGLGLTDDGSFIYIPNPGFRGEDQFSYVIVAGNHQSQPATVTISVGAEVPAPNGLNVVGDLAIAPVLPEFIFTPAQLSTQNGDRRIIEPGEWYNVYVEKDGVVVIDAWREANEVCEFDYCRVRLTVDDLPTGLLNGFFHWKVRSWSQATGLSDFSDLSTFSVSVPVSEGPTGLTVTTDKPYVQIAMDGDEGAAWYQIYILNENDVAFGGWIPKPENCNGLTCILRPPAHPVGGTYQVWIQAWGPAGFNKLDANHWVQAPEITISANLLERLEPLTPTITADSQPIFRWQGDQNATWYNIWLGTADFSETVYFDWIWAFDAGCADGEICSHNPHVPLQAGKTYVWFIQAWGPGGMSTNGDFPAPMDSWVEGPSLSVP